MAPTQAERSAATQKALLTAARRLWGGRGYAAVSTPEIAEAAGVTRGAMYHQYPDKQTLFLSVLGAVQSDVIERLRAAVAARQPKTPADALRISADAWLEIAGEPEVRQLVLLDAPSVLGWAGVREMSVRYGLGMTERLLSAAIDAGELKPQPTRPLATVVIGALDEAAMSIANADDPEREKAEVLLVIHDLIDGLLIKPRVNPMSETDPPGHRPSAHSEPAGGRIRAYRPTDEHAIVTLSMRAWAPVFASLEQALGLELLHRLRGDWRTQQAQAVRAALSAEATRVWVGERQRRVVAFIAATLDRENLVGEVSFLAVDPDQQRTGLGTALTDRATDWFQRSGMQVAMIETGGDPGHAAARGLYQKTGYTPLPIVRYFKAL